jgi:hypothetical protein
MLFFVEVWILELQQEQPKVVKVVQYSCWLIVANSSEEIPKCLMAGVEFQFFVY